MSEQLQEALSLIRTDVKCLEDAARHIEELASKLDPKEKVKWDLVAAVYRERRCTGICFGTFPTV